MLFRKKIERSCAYCIYSTKLESDCVLCIKHGVVPIDKNCRKFRYDPCKRIPPKPKAMDFAKFDSEDYSL